MRRVFRLALFAFFLSSLAFTCGAAAQSLNAAGATFPYPIYSKWFNEYHKAHPDVQINYQPIGSGGGIQQLLSGTVDFGASDGPMTDEQLSQAKIKIFHIPTVLGAVVPAYNIPGYTGKLRFSQQVLAGIFLGNIKQWNDPAIKRDNPGVNLPDTPIVVVHRGDGSGTTYIFTDFLSKISPEWQSKVGKGTAVKWPTGLAMKGNDGVAGLIRQTPGGMGYVELIYALQNNITFGSVQNAAGKFIEGSLQSTTAAAASVKDMPSDFRVSITNAPGASAYPICSFTWLLIPAQWADKSKEKAVTDFLQWMVKDGEPMVSALNYAPLPKSVAEKVSARIKEIN